MKRVRVGHDSLNYQSLLYMGKSNLDTDMDTCNEDSLQFNLYTSYNNLIFSSMFHHHNYSTEWTTVTLCTPFTHVSSSTSSTSSPRTNHTPLPQAVLFPRMADAVMIHTQFLLLMRPWYDWMHACVKHPAHDHAHYTWKDHQNLQAVECIYTVICTGKCYSYQGYRWIFIVEIIRMFFGFTK